MKNHRWQIFLAAALVALSVILYVLHFAFFRDARHIFLYLLGDLAFLPLEVLLVTLIIHRLLSVREKRAMLNKLNMVIGAFFSEVGTALLKRLVRTDAEAPALAEEVSGVKAWEDARFAATSSALRGRTFRLEPAAEDLLALRQMLVAKRPFLLALLENPNLLEHERFTELLWAVFHLCEELEHRGSFADLPATDIAHLEGDLRRAYALLLVEWIEHLRHRKREYPYLFSLAVRTNPLDAGASVVVT